MDLFDIGANLTHDAFDADRESVLDRAIAAGVSGMMVTGSSLTCSRKALALAQSHPALLRCTAGVHPHHAAEHDSAQLHDLATLWDAPEVLAIGETGLDFFRDFSPRPAQERVFEWHLEQAAHLGLPLFLHERDAHERFLAMIRAARDAIGDAVVHCFTGDRTALYAYLDLDLYVGITGWICDERRGRHLLELVRDIPADRLMIETDCPYLLPRDLRPRPRDGRNEPAFLPHVHAAVARARGDDPVELARRTTANARRFFRWPAAAEGPSEEAAARMRLH
ncbi:TatD family hydrolase [Candidatus Macondimonas diazotrophica]|jgi:TatD DNase family protein|uniref:Hydrolase TatD n=1 Tax=Candidatus Macondimonas diazotrophica TaxID=2305248 RepID=A0A4Z0F9E1_9GAMM|nr:TatD family hydrolase [Candidatus Macondimonas diazotrophica]NCU00197.1 hydrolase TatD [Candidatus Macondimonas diazotrophica]TFZ82994.1 hydrolase TatD [Candidatus Macondimonas diazotrophica]